MSSSDAPQAKPLLPRDWPRMARGVCAAVLAGMALAGCSEAVGFRPVYGSLGGANVEDKLSRVEITIIPGRNGQRIRNELVFSSTGGGKAGPASYRLDTAIRESSTTTLVSADGESAAQVYQIDATFRLVDLKNSRTLLQGTSMGRAAYERVVSVYSNTRGADDAQERAAKSVATDIKSRLAAFLSTVKD